MLEEGDGSSPRPCRDLVHPSSRGFFLGALRMTASVNKVVGEHAHASTRAVVCSAWLDLSPMTLLVFRGSPASIGLGFLVRIHIRNIILIVS